jgi:hypothetical protein
MNNNTDRLLQLHDKMNELKSVRSATKVELSAIEKQMVIHMVELRTRCIDASGRGEGPFWVLAKGKTDGSWNRERYLDFFDILLRAQSDKAFNPAELANSAADYIRQFEKRSLALNRVTQFPRNKTIDDLLAWLNEPK